MTNFPHGETNILVTAINQAAHYGSQISQALLKPANQQQRSIDKANSSHLVAPWRTPANNQDESKFQSLCAFCHLFREPDLTGHVLFRGKFNLVKLNSFPYALGHSMIIPYTHLGNLSQLSSSAGYELFDLLQVTQQVLQAQFSPQGFNIGMNQGQAGGGSIPGHIHLHLVPRYNGDANFMTILSNTTVLSETLEESYQKLKTAMKAHYRAHNDFSA
jgi:ATP adenylyltransferase